MLVTTLAEVRVAGKNFFIIAPPPSCVTLARGKKWINWQN
jgi:hypothetical protein